MRVILRRGNDQVVTLQGLRTTKTGVYLNEATVKATLMDSRNQIVQPFEEVTMNYVSGSNGDYEWLIEGETLLLKKNVEYSLEIKAEESGLNYRTVHAVSVVDGDVCSPEC